MSVKDIVREKYGQAALRVTESGRASCCGTVEPCCDPITSNLYDDAEAGELPDTALSASLGCGNPTALADLRPGDVVLDLGSGGGIDVLLSARRVGPTGKAYGLDMTDEMLSLANENRLRAGVSNVEFLKGHIEQIPLPDAAVDVIISNCVINLSVDKALVLREAFRVLKPGGRFAVSDVLVHGTMPDDLRRSMELWVGCVAGALEQTQFEHLMHQAGFVDVSFETTRVYNANDAQAFLDDAGLDGAGLAGAVDGQVVSAFIRARKPAELGAA
jgi:SAM-dependent methyltransferase